MFKVLSVIFLALFCTLSAYADKQYYLHIRYKNGSDAGINYYSSSYDFNESVSADKSSISLTVKNKNDARLQQQISIKETTGSALSISDGLIGYHLSYIKGSPFNFFGRPITGESGALIDIKGFNCESPHQTNDSVKISKLVFNAENKLDAVHIDFSKGCEHDTPNYEEESSFINGSLVIYDASNIEDAGFHSNFQHNFYDQNGKLITLAATDKTHNLKFRGDDTWSAFSVVHSEEHTPMYGGGEDGFILQVESAYEQNNIHFLSPMEIETKPGYDKRGLEFNFLTENCRNHEFARVKMNNISLTPLHHPDIEEDFSLSDAYNSGESEFKSIQMEYNVYCGNLNEFDDNGHPAKLIAFGIIDLKDLSEDIARKLAETEELQQANLYLSENLKTTAADLLLASEKVKQLESANQKLTNANNALTLLEKSVNSVIPQVVKALNNISAKYCKTNGKVNTACKKAITSANSKLEELIKKPDLPTKTSSKPTAKK